MKTSFILMLAAVTLLTACKEDGSPEAEMNAFCRELNAGNWLSAVKRFPIRQPDGTLLHEAHASDPPETQSVTDALMKGARCEVTASTDDSVTVAFNIVNARLVMAEAMQEHMDREPTAGLGVFTDMAARAQAPEAPRLQMNRTVKFERSAEGRWQPTAASMTVLANTLLGNTINPD